MKVLCALSGGVDSAVCAHLLQQAGYEVAGAMMRLHDYGNINSEIESARKICDQLNIDFIELDKRENFKEHVVNYFMSTYIAGKTPNPCIECNRHLKFGEFFLEAEARGFDKIATGHYAQIEQKTLCDKETYLLRRAVDTSKDQSYVLHFLNQNQLSKILLPLGTYKKDEIRKIADDLNLEVANKPESQDICFVENGKYTQFITENSNFIPLPGDIVDMNGNIVGQHKGLINYTIGQRKGIDIAFGQPMYVVSIDAKNNKLVMGQEQDTMSSFVILHDFNWISSGLCEQVKKASDDNVYSAKLRYRHVATPCNTEILDKNNERPSKVKLTFSESISAVTPGQFGVIYHDDYVVGGGTIV